MRFGELFRVPLHADDVTALIERAADVPRELAQSAPDIEDGFVPVQRQFAEASLVEQLIESGESSLLFGCGAVNVAIGANADGFKQK